MLLTLAAGLALAAAQQIDTTVTAERGQRLQVNAYGGEVTVRAWNRNAVRVEANTSGRTRVEIVDIGDERRASAPRGGTGRPPRWTSGSACRPGWPLTLSGVQYQCHVDGTRAPISVETVEGEVDVTGGDGLISLRSVQGSVTLRGAKGRISVNSVNEDVEVANSTGEIMAETVNGEITLEAVDAATVDASTVNGDICVRRPHPERRTLLPLHPQRRHHSDSRRRHERERGGVHLQRRVRVRVPGAAERNPEGKGVQLHPRLRQRPGHPGIVSGHHPAGPPRRPGRPRAKGTPPGRLEGA